MNAPIKFTKEQLVHGRALAREYAAKQKAQANYANTDEFKTKFAKCKAYVQAGNTLTNDLYREFPVKGVTLDQFENWIVPAIVDNTKGEQAEFSTFPTVMHTYKGVEVILMFGQGTSVTMQAAAPSVEDGKLRARAKKLEAKNRKLSAEVRRLHAALEGLARPGSEFGCDGCQGSAETSRKELSLSNLRMRGVLSLRKQAQE